MMDEPHTYATLKAHSKPIPLLNLCPKHVCFKQINLCHGFQNLPRP